MALHLLFTNRQYTLASLKKKREKCFTYKPFVHLPCTNVLKHFDPLNGVTAAGPVRGTTRQGPVAAEDKGQAEFFYFYIFLLKI